MWEVVEDDKGSVEEENPGKYSARVSFGICRGTELYSPNQLLPDYKVLPRELVKRQSAVVKMLCGIDANVARDLDQLDGTSTI